MLLDTGYLTEGGPYSQIDKKDKNKEEKYCTDKALAKNWKTGNILNEELEKKGLCSKYCNSSWEIIMNLNYFLHVFTYNDKSLHCSLQFYFIVFTYLLCNVTKVTYNKRLKCNII